MKTLLYKKSSKMAGSFLFIGLVSLTGCQNSLSSRGFVPSDNSNNGNAEESFGMNELGVKNYLQIADTMASVTGLVMDNESNIRNFYSSNKTNLPIDNSSSKISANQLLTITNFATEWCETLANKTSTNNPPSSFFAGTSFALVNSNTNHNPNVLLGPAEKRLELVNLYLDRFLGIGADDESTYAQQTREELLNVIGDLMDGVGNPGDIPNSASGTRRMMTAVCVPPLASTVLF